MGLREIKMGRTRRQIADHAFALFMSQGFESTTIEQIAGAAEVGTRTLYRYYPTKESLIVDFVETSLGAAVEELRKQPDDMPLPQALYTMVETVMRVTREDTDRVLAVYQLAEGAPSVKARLAEQALRWRIEVAGEVSRRTGGGEQADLVAALTAANAMNIIDITMRTWVMGGGARNPDSIAAEILHVLHEGVPIPTAPAAVMN
ncbi:MAG TPA: TetR/AcrR family transcriptional regulator [Pseudonocardiaceae bacterium]|nr:TetR/AcrR family transcriptional regulator [Pseudonocardiaceae bacterium]